MRRNAHNSLALNWTFIIQFRLAFPYRILLGQRKAWKAKTRPAPNRQLNHLYAPPLR